MDDLHRFEVFVRVAELASFSAAARALKMAQSQVSRQVRELEERVGSALFTRTTRKVTLTAEGATYLGAVRSALGILADAEEAVRASRGTVSGTLRLTAPLELGEYLAPVLHDLLARHPALAVDLVLTDRIVDLVEEGFDLGVRFGQQRASSLRARRIGAIESVLCASAAYAARHGLPKHPRDLERHEHVLFTAKAAPDKLTLFDEHRRAVSVRIAGRFRANELRAVRLAVLAGSGLGMLPLPLAAPAFAEGTLVRALPAWSGRTVPVHVVFPPRSPQPPRVTAFIERLVAGKRLSRR
ncbi:LysR family transcriptional regulator [Pendulispora albinea]|uniref:LysR family transcriptional regulator n=1 Tax=Pendulispora albinea TaxID=2741071 RepID=A0ABZ2MBW2_9BACT